jgi:hypothetical protein
MGVQDVTPTISTSLRPARRRSEGWPLCASASAEVIDAAVGGAASPPRAGKANCAAPRPSPRARSEARALRQQSARRARAPRDCAPAHAGGVAPLVKSGQFDELPPPGRSY